MKSFRQITQQIDRWRHQHRPPPPSQLTCHLSDRSTPSDKLRTATDRIKKIKPPPSAASPARRRKRHPLLTAILASTAVLSLTSAIGYRFYNEPQLAVGTISPETHTAPSDATVEDTQTTEAAREAARTGAIPVLMVDEAASQQIRDSFDRVLERAEAIQNVYRPFPYLDSDELSIATQRYVQQVEDWEWLDILADARQESPRDSTPAISQLKPLPDEPSSDEASSDEARRVEPSSSNDAALSLPPTSSSTLNGSMALALSELKRYRRGHSSVDFESLVREIEQARNRLSQARVLLDDQSSDLDYSFQSSFLMLTDDEWQGTQVGMRRVMERMLIQGIAPGLPGQMIEAAVQAQVQVDVPEAGQPLAIEWLARVLRPNLIQDPEQTRRRAEQAAEAVDPEIIEIRKDEVIVEEGEAITQSDFVLLDHFGMSERRINHLSLAGFAALISGSIALFWLTERIFAVQMRMRDHVLVLLLVLTTPLAIALGLPGSSLAAVGLLIGSFYGSALGVTLIAILGVVLPIGMNVGLNALIASAVGSAVGAILSGRLRSREELALLGLGVGLTQGIVYLILSLMMLGTVANPVWYAVLTTAALQSLLGVAWSIVALGVSPYLEHAFDLVTPTRLVELSSPNRPLLKRLSSEAPGTFQHTLFVATLAEAAARKLGCNVELIRAGTLYHDIGKMHDAQGFIENQMGGPNKHDAINDPWKSAAIIKKHVSEGLVMARRCRLPGSVQAFIPEHQGTMLIAYFYHQAQQLAQQNPELVVREEDFRYDGPIPQSRETGIVMLADSCEAALRSLKDATAQEALATVNKIMRNRWQDNQLVDAGLSRADLTEIASIFVAVWQQFNHKRIPYPKAVLNPK